MKKLILPLLSIMMLTSCNTGSTSNEITIDIPTDLGVTLTDLEDVKKGSAGDKHNVYGVVAQFTYGYDTNLGKDAPVGFYIVDNTSSMYVYSGVGTLTGISIGNTVLVTGEITYFISEPEASAGEEIGYYGAQQIAAETVTLVKDGFTETPNTGIETKSIKELATTDFRENDLSGTIYRVNATVTYIEVSGTDVYYFNDPSMDYSIYTYSTISGREYSWLESFVGGTYEFTIGVHSLRSRDEAWRCVPIRAYKEVTPTDEDAANYALSRLAKQFSSTYNTTTEIDLVAKDEKLTDATITYSTDSKDHTIKQDGERIYLAINGEKLGKFNVTINLEYKGKDYKEVIEVEVIEKPTFDGITIAEVQNTAEGEVVKIKGIYVRFAANVQGVYIADETGIIPVYYTAGFEPDDYLVGEELVFEGTVELDFTDGGTKPGYKRLSNSTLLSHDSVVHEWNKDLVEGEATITDLLDGDVNRVAKIYKVRGKIKYNDAGYYTNMLLEDIDTDNYLSLYCSGASQLEWLKEFDGEEHTFYVFIRDKKGTKLRFEVLDLE